MRLRSIEAYSGLVTLVLFGAGIGGCCYRAVVGYVSHRVFRLHCLEPTQRERERERERESERLSILKVIVAHSYMGVDPLPNKEGTDEATDAWDFDLFLSKWITIFFLKG